MPERRVQILGIPGSLRCGSRNRGLLLAAREVAPDNIDIALADLSTIPLYNADMEAAGDPPGVQTFKAGISAADALLIATPEYNHLLSGVLKNALDWASLPDGGSVLARKPVAIMGASGGAVGTARAQLSLRQVLTATECYVLPSPQVIIGNASDRFDSNGRLIDGAMRERIRSLLDALLGWVYHFQSR